MDNDQIIDANYLLNKEALGHVGIFTKYSKVYPFTTENISAYYKKFNLKDKSILTVCSSGDHLFNAMLYEPKCIDCFDINTYANYYMLLKKAMIEKLSYEDFMKCFNGFGEANWWTSRDFINIFESINDKIDNKAITFWNTIYDYLRSKHDLDNDLFFDRFFVWSGTYQCRTLSLFNDYLAKDKFELLKEKINNYELNFIRSNVVDLPNTITKKYDYILLSNISGYLRRIYHGNYLEHYKNFIMHELSGLLNPNGIIALAYIYYFYGEELYRGDNLEECNLMNVYSIRERAYGNVFEKIIFTDTVKKLRRFSKRDKSGVLLYKKSN